MVGSGDVLGTFNRYPSGACEIGWFSNGDKDGLLLIIAKEISYVLQHMQNEYRTKQCTFQCVKYSLKRNQNDVLRVDNLTSFYL
ncbi:hypothetical protein L1987_18354 [Smallanthus sonchifolius]|uniref:Uncharacterized protein n=1 Tax=Smallanthus sonchifolius TaxID=185202 RepID=A0ACB9J1I3_9ASTR|nr:hypothetical protein L1987_18354 [Smallanthus sonchifolius]